MRLKLHLALATFIVLAMASVGISQESVHQHQHHDDQGAKKDEKSKTSHSHSDHLDGVNSRGDRAMGFSHTRVTHHFRLTRDGGTIEVTANDPKDTESIDLIKKHFEQISKSFAEGDFNKSVMTHGKTPPGVPTMARLKSEIDYKYEGLERGGRIRLTTKNTEALAAIHEFLRFQIKDHQTGDSLEVEPEK
ncbi:MAG TPA: hypothetical protein VNI02_20825 [Blastocatellia bacterium]|jgi:hypothetical protein|nr:hypothetical protein [Blastocatellia bacterium]